MKKHDDRFEKMKFQVKRNYILKSLDLKSKISQKIWFQMKKVDLSMVGESYYDYDYFSGNKLVQELQVYGKTSRTLCVELTYFTTLHTPGVSVTASMVKNMDLAKQKTR